ncbi:148_t:CDS:2 [Entrophospora sp. SA101]|nr:148_t:CDS:2 [Entrophospora sp. SA101]
MVVTTWEWLNWVTDTDAETTVERIKCTRHPAIIDRKEKWEIEENFEGDLNDPSFYQEL